MVTNDAENTLSTLLIVVTLTSCLSVCLSVGSRCLQLTHRRHGQLCVNTVAPVINRQDIDTHATVSVNGSSVLNCVASGYPSPQLIWLRNGRPLDPQLHPNIRLLADARQLSIRSAAVADAAVYRCLATNKAGQDHLDYHLDVHSKLTRPLSSSALLVN